MKKICLLVLFIASTVCVQNLFAQGCPGLASVTLNVLPPPIPTVLGAGEFCTSSTTLSVTPFFNGYTWSTGETTQAIAVTTSGTYTVTVTNSNGCEGTASAVVTYLPDLQPNITASPYACNGQISLTASPGFNTYSWSNGSSGQGTTVNSSGPYTVTVTNVDGCTGTSTFNASIPPPPVVSISGSTSVCQGESINLNASSGFSSYSWSNGQSGSNISVINSGTYAVTVSDGFGCTATTSQVVNQIPAPIPNITGAPSACQGISITLDAGPGFSSYLWSNGPSTQTTQVSTTNTYTVTVTATNGCTGTDSQTFTTLSQPQPNITAAPYACNDQLVLNAGAGFLGYSWSNGPAGPLSTVTTSGNFTVTVTDASGCTGTDVFFADIPTDPVVSISGADVFCENGFTTLIATGGFNAYAWNTGEATPDIDVISAGTFTVTVTDAFGCTAINSLTTNTLPAPQPSISGVAIVCENISTNFDAGAGFASYNWSIGSSAQSIDVSTAGIYSVTVTAGNGCTGTDSETLLLLPVPTPDILESTYLCDGELTLSAGGVFSSYNWSTGATSQAITINNSGNFQITVTGSNGCTGTDSYDVNIPSTPFVDISGENQFCPGNSATLDATPGFVSYAWAGGQTGSSIDVAQAGNYTVTVTDFFGCTATDVFGVTALTAPVPGISGPTSICAGSNATFTVNGSFNSYLWSSGQSTSFITVNTAGDYTVTVTNTAGCTGSATQSLTLGTSLQTQIVVQPYQCNGQLTLDAGAGFVSYTWTGGQTTQTLNVNVDGIYAVTVSDATGCSGTATINAGIPPPPNVTVTGDAVICQGETASISASAGFSSYLWSNGQVGPNISVTTSDTFTVTVTDNPGCTDVASFVVDVTTAPQPQITGPSQLCNGSSGTLGVAGAFSSYAWSTGETTPTISVNAAGTIGLTVTDTNGCTGTTSQNVTVGNSIQTQITPLPYACDGQITLDAGTGFATYTWTGGQTTQIISATLNGTYIVTVTDAAGCSGTATLFVSIPVQNTVAISGDNVLCAGETTTLTASAGFVNYLWTGGQTLSFISVNQSGTYGVTATDALGCTATALFGVNVLAIPQVQITGPTQLCNGSNSTLGVAGAFSSYAWSTGETTPTISVNAAGTIGLTVTDANGCTGTTSQNVTVGNSLQTQITPLPYACDGQIILDAGAGFATYTWTGGQTTQTISATQNGTYNVTVTDGAGCTGTATINATVPFLPLVTITGPAAFCEGQTVSIAATEGFAGYLWTGGQTTSNLQVSQPGTYFVTVTDGLGCTTTASQNMTEAPINNLQIALTTCDPTAVGTVENSFINQFGCDSVVVVVTTLAPDIVVTAEVTTNYNGFGVACFEETNGGVQANVSGGTAPFNYVWNQGGVTGNLSNLPVGTYTVTVTDASGCSGTAGALLNAPEAILIETDVAQPDCDQDGMVDITLATGGVAPYSFTIGIETQTGDGLNPVTFGGLGPGIQTIQVTDNNGCIVVTQAVLQAFTPVQTTYTETFDINAGESIQLIMPVNFVPQNIFWAPSTGLSCTDCLNPSLAPANSTVVNVQVEGLNGCEASGMFLINVKKGGNVYIPNAFNPSGIFNNTFNAYGDDRVFNIRTLQVFDRWGNKIAVLDNLTPNDPAQGWDGRFRGEDMQPGVYAYWMKIEYVDGTSEVFSGDVTIVR